MRELQGLFDSITKTKIYGSLLSKEKTTTLKTILKKLDFRVISKSLFDNTFLVYGATVKVS